MIKSEKVTLTDVFVNFFLGCAKYFLGFISGSLALKADAYHSFLDILIPLFIFIGLRMSQTKNKNFPFGLYKIENLLSLFIGVIMLLAGFELIKESFWASNLIKGEQIFFTSTAVLLLAILNFLWANYKIKVGQELLSPSITSDGFHSRIESCALLLVAFGLASSLWHNLPLDRALAILISLSIFKLSATIIWDALKILLDGMVDQATYKQIRTILIVHPLVESVSELLIRRAGKFLFIEAVIILKCNSLDLATQVKNELQATILQTIANIERLTLNYVKSSKLVYAVMADSPDGLISQRLAQAPHVFLLRNQSGNKPKLLTNPVIQLEKQKGIQLVNFLKSQKVDIVITRNTQQNKNIITLLQNAGIRHVTTELANIDEFLQKPGPNMSLADLTLNSGSDGSTA